MIDFCMVDSELSSVPFAQAFDIAAGLELDKTLETIVIKVLKLSKKKFADLKKDWEKDRVKV